MGHIELGVGKPYRGVAAFLPPDIVSVANLWRHGIPTTNEHSQHRARQPRVDGRGLFRRRRYRHLVRLRHVFARMPREDIADMKRLGVALPAPSKPVESDRGDIMSRLRTVIVAIK
jgi:hypothetical protein